MARVRYARHAADPEHLDSATSTTFPGDETLIAVGCAAASRAVDLADGVTLDRLTAQQVRAWDLAEPQESQSGLKTVARRMALETSGNVEPPDLDTWEREGEGWAYSFEFGVSSLQFRDCSGAQPLLGINDGQRLAWLTRESRRKHNGKRCDNNRQNREFGAGGRQRGEPGA